MSDIFIAFAKRTPIGSFLGALSNLSAVELGVFVLKSILEQSKLDPNIIDEIILGSVLTAAQGQAPARQVALGAGLNNNTQALTINKVCSSGLKATLLASDSIRCGRSSLVVSGGIESMSQAPFLIKNARSGLRLGHQKLIDSIICDGLWDVYNDFHMGQCAELCASKYSFTREEQDAYAVQSYKKALTAIESGFFKDEIVSLTNGLKEVSEDEEPKKFKPDKVSTLKPAFKTDGTVTAVNASSINDGASLMFVCSEQFLKENPSFQVQARIISEGYGGREPEWFTTAPVLSIKNALKNSALTLADIDLIEINEAFSVVPMAVSKELELDPLKVNVSGGAVALGHPIGASGARILTTLMYNMRRLSKKYGLASICNGGGEASSLIIENLQ